MAALAKLLCVSLLPALAYGASSAHSLNTNCTGVSSKLASWSVRNFTVDTDTKFDFGPGTVGKVSFSITNAANGYSFNCLQGSGPTGRSPNHYLVDGKVWYSCNVYCKGARGQPEEDDPALDTSLHFDIKTKALTIRQTWGCSGWNQSTMTNYTGTGTSVLSNLTCTPIPGARADQVTCAPADFTLKATDVVTGGQATDEGEISQDEPYFGDGSSPFLPTIYPKPGVLPGTQGCTKMSKSSSFAISKLSWSGAGVAFTLKNNALNYTQKCSIRGRMESQTWWNCTKFDPLHANYPPNGIYTSLLYGGPRNILGVNQTWYCDDEDASQPTVYTAYGEVDFPLKCNETRSCVAPGPYAETQESEKIVEDFCNADDLTIAPTSVRAYRVSKEAAVQDFSPRGYNCSSKSLEPAGKQVWDIDRFSLTKTFLPGDDKLNVSASNSYEVRFYYNNTATDNDSPRNTGWRQCLYTSPDMESELDGVKQLECTMTFEPYTLGFKFDNKTSAITLSQEWSCDGIDSQHTNFFKAVGSGSLPLKCTSEGMSTQCLAGHRLAVPMLNITSRLNSNDEEAYSYPF